MYFYTFCQNTEYHLLAFDNIFDRPYISLNCLIEKLLIIIGKLFAFYFDHGDSDDPSDNMNLLR